MKWEYEKELIINTLGYIQHDNCIKHCLKFAFKNCKEEYPKYYKKYYQVDFIFQQILQIIPNEKEQIIKITSNCNIIRFIKLEKFILIYNLMQHYFI